MMEVFEAEQKCKKFASVCLNRQLRSHQRNCVQDRLLRECNDRYDRYQKKECKNQNYILDGIQKEYGNIVHRSPSVSEWMQRQHLDSWRERERQRLENKHKYSIRQYKVPNVIYVDNDGMQLGANGMDPLGKVHDSEDLSDAMTEARPMTDARPMSSIRRTCSDASDRPRTTRVRRRSSLSTDVRSGPRQRALGRRCTTSLADIEDYELDIF